MINRENFKNILETIGKQRKFDNEAAKALNDIFTDFGGWYNNEILFSGIESMLISEFNDEGDWISYFMYELNYGTVDYASHCGTTKNNGNIDLSSIDKLYDFLMENIDENS